MESTEQQLEILHEKIGNLENILILALKFGNIGIWSWDLKTNYLWWDNKMFELFGKSKEHFNYDYSFFKNSVHPEDIAGVEENINNCLKQRVPYKYFFRVITDDKKIKNISGEGNLMLDADGNPISLIGVCFDCGIKKIE